MAVDKTCETRSSFVVFALAAPIGVDTKSVVDKLYRLCKDRNIQYECQEIVLSQSISEKLPLDSDVAKNYPHDPNSFASEAAQKNIIKINQGNYANEKIKDFITHKDTRENTEYNAHALCALADIQAYFSDTNNPDKTAFVIRSLKRVDEVALLRKVFQNSFFMFGLSSCRESRLDYLQRKKSMEPEDAEKLIDIDEYEKADWGQKMSKLFQHADAFIDMDSKDWERQIERIFNLIFGHPYITPNPDEFAMNIASQASFRSADLSRQVGAAIFSPEHDILAVGCNEVPHYGGGQYWCDEENDARDFQTGHDPNKKEIKKLTASIMEDVQADPNYAEIAAMIENALSKNLDKITEYGRSVHAEMEALLSAARVGVSVRGASLYSTTFPCHNCAKHIVDAGIKRVIYIEPYPKSLSETLHHDSITHTANKGEHPDKVCFSPFVGVAPRRFADLFQVRITANHNLKRKKDEHETVEWKKRLRISCPLSKKHLLETLHLYTQKLKKEK